MPPGKVSVWYLYLGGKRTNFFELRSAVLLRSSAVLTGENSSCIAAATAQLDALRYAAADAARCSPRHSLSRSFLAFLALI